MNRQTDYAYRLHDRQTENDPELATVMYSVNGPEGPWYDMATGHPDHIEEILGALRWCEDERQMRREQEAARFRAEFTRYDNLVSGNDTENKVDITLDKFGITLESQGSAKPASNSETDHG